MCVSVQVKCTRARMAAMSGPHRRPHRPHQHRCSPRTRAPMDPRACTSARAHARLPTHTAAFLSVTRLALAQARTHARTHTVGQGLPALAFSTVAVALGLRHLCACVRVCARVCACVRACVHVCVRVPDVVGVLVWTQPRNVPECACVQAKACMRGCVGACACMCACVRVCACVCVCVRAYVDMSICVCMRGWRVTV